MFFPVNFFMEVQESYNRLTEFYGLIHAFQNSVEIEFLQNSFHAKSAERARESIFAHLDILYNLVQAFCNVSQTLEVHREVSVSVSPMDSFTPERDRSVVRTDTTACPDPGHRPNQLPPTVDYQRRSKVQTRPLESRVTPRFVPPYQQRGATIRWQATTTASLVSCRG